MSVSSSPTVLKRWIARELRRLREAAGYTRPQASQRLGKATAQIGHLETGRNLPTAADLEVLLTWYGVPERIELFRDLLQQAKKGRDWWLGYAGAVRESFGLFLGLEASAVQIHRYDAVLVPGIFQTPAYAEAVIRGEDPAASDREVATRIELRMTRQQILNRAGDQPQLRAIIDEGVLHRRVGGVRVLAEQLGRLIELADYPNVDIQVLPTAAAAYGVDGSFTWLAFPPELPDEPGVVHVQTQVRSIYYEDPGDVLVYRSALRRLHAHAASPEQSVALIETIANELAAMAR